LEYEKTKQKPRPARVEELTRQKEEADERVLVLDSVLETLVSEVIEQRAKDVMAEVRALVGKALGMWVLH